MVNFQWSMVIRVPRQQLTIARAPLLPFLDSSLFCLDRGKREQKKVKASPRPGKFAGGAKGRQPSLPGAPRGASQVCRVRVGGFVGVSRMRFTLRSRGEFPVSERPYFFSEAKFLSATGLTFFRKQISCRRQALLFFGSEFPVGDRPYFFSEANFSSATALTFFRKRISRRRQHLLFFGSKFPVGDSTYFFSEANFQPPTALTFFRK